MKQAHETELSAIQAKAIDGVKNLFEEISESAGDLEAHDAEMNIFRGLRKIGVQLLDGYFTAKGTGDVGLVLQDDDGSKYKRVSQNQPFKYLSLFGKVEVTRTGYWCHGRPLIYPLDAQANLPYKHHSYALQELVNDLCKNIPFQEGVRHINKWIGVSISDFTAEQITQESSNNYEAFYASKPIPPAAPIEDHLVVSLDGKGVPMIKKEAAKIKAKLRKGEKRLKTKEALVGVVYTAAPKTRTAEEIAENLVYPEKSKERRKNEGLKADDTPRADNIRRLASVAKPKIKVVEEVLQEAEKRDPDRERALSILVDGDPTLERLAKEAFDSWPEEQQFLILDIIHVRDYVWKVAHALYQEGSDEAAAYVYKQLAKILKGQVNNVICGMKTSMGKRKLKGAKAKAILDTVRYFKNHKHMMQYDVYLHWGFQIATGVVESTCKSLVKNRMEGCGMRWSIVGAEAMLRLRSISLSHDWDDYWPFHISMERERLYGKTMRMLSNRSYALAA